MLPICHRILTIFITLAFLSTILFLSSNGENQQQKCRPIYVRWPRVRLNTRAAKQGALSQTACRNVCTNDKDPIKNGLKLQCSAFNHRTGQKANPHECQIFQKDSVQYTDGYVEADDQYTFFWKYCVETELMCAGDYAFTYYSDHYTTEVARIVIVKSLEECLAECLNDGRLLCRSFYFNRTDGGCHISEHDQTTKPGSIRVNSNPNFRVDYYENDCYNNSFVFSQKCESKGVRIQVNSKVPYSGALYGLYDFFSCRVEPKESRNFDHFFPYPFVSNNCSDSMRESGSDLVLETVLSTDGVEPLYFITANDLTYQARCPMPKQQNDQREEDFGGKYSGALPNGNNELSNKEKGKEHKRYGTSVQQILDALEAGEKKFKNEVVEKDEISYKTHGVEEKQPVGAALFGSATKTSSTATKDIFSLEPYIWTTTTGPSIMTPRQNNNTSPSVNSSSSKTTTNMFSTESSSPPPPTTIVAIQRQQNHNSSVAAAAGENQAPTTIAAIQRIANDDSRAPVLSSSTSPLTTGSTIVTKRNTPGMEAITDFIRYHHNSRESGESVSSSSTTTTATTTIGTTPETVMTTRIPTLISELNSSSSIGASPQQQRDTIQKIDPSEPHKFSFSTHISFPTDSNRIHMRMDPALENHRGLTSIDGIDKSASPVPATGAMFNEKKEDWSSSSITTKSSSVTTPSTTSPTTTTISTTTTTPTTTTSSTTTTTSTTTLPSTTTTREDGGSHHPNHHHYQNSGYQRAGSKRPSDKVIFDIFHNGQPTEAVVVGSRITLSFTPFYAIPPAYMSISGCQVEPIGSLYDWEKEPLAIIKDGCQADHVGLVCPPQRTDYGIRVTVEAFRYQTTTQVQYTCMIRVCPFAPCPQNTCPLVEGCPGDELIARGFGFASRRKRAAQELSLEQIRAALAANPQLQQQLGLTIPVHTAPLPVSLMSPSSPASSSTSTSFKMNNSLQQQLILLGGDTIVHRRLIVVNTEEELKFWHRTGEVPRGNFK